MSKVLVVDDIPDNVRLLSYELEDQGYEVLTACSGDEALEVVRSERPDAVLLDVMMPPPDGIEVCRRLKQDPDFEPIPVILVTAKDLDDEVIKGLDAGAHDYITKPFNASVLAARLRSALRAKESHDAFVRLNQDLQKEIAERTRIASALRDSEEKFRKIGASAQDAIIMMDPGGNVSFWNNAAERLFGYTAEEMRGRSVHETLAAPAYRGLAHAALPQFRKTGHGAAVGKTLELTALRRDGEEIPIELSLSATQIDGKPYGIAVIRDITERKRAEESQRQDEERFRLAAESVSDLVYEWDAATDRLEWFGDVDAALGFDPGEISRTIAGWFDLIHPDDRAVLEASIERHRTSTEPISEEYRIRRKDGEWRYWIDRGTPVLNADGSPTKWIGACIDITDRKHAEEALRQREEFLHDILEATCEGIVVVDNDLEILHVNSTFVAMWRVRPDLLETKDGNKVLAQSLDQLEDPEAFQAKVKCLTGTDSVASDTLRFEDGRVLDYVSVPLIQNGETVGRITSFRDVTQRERAEKELCKKQEELRRSQKLEAVGQLAGGVAHEFNNLLQAIRGYTEYAQEGLSPEEERYQDLEEVCKATDRAAALTRQLLGFGRRQMLERKNVDTNEVVSDLTKMIRPVIGEHIKQENRLAEDAGIVHADPGELQQALLNLCLNARDAMPSGGTLLLKTEKVVFTGQVAASRDTILPGTYVVLSVTDTGCGMTPEVRERVFEPFFTTKEVGKGAGLGLATVYGIVKQHGGTIHVYTESGQGTSFKIFLPAVDAVPDTGKTVCAVAAAAGGSETILVAEDEPVVRNLMVRMLKQAGYRVLAACDGHDALRVFKENRGEISLLLLDAVMPGLSGHAVYRRIREEAPEVKAIFCTGYDPETAQSSHIAQENLRLIQKPIDSAGLLLAVRETLDANHAPPAPSYSKHYEVALSGSA